MCLQSLVPLLMITLVKVMMMMVVVVMVTMMVAEETNEAWKYVVELLGIVVFAHSIYR